MIVRLLFRQLGSETWVANYLILNNKLFYVHKGRAHVQLHTVLCDSA